MKKTSMIACFVALVSSAAVAQDNYLCSNGDLQRRVVIVHETDAGVPCAVHYYKDTEAPGEEQVLWQAKSEEGYCEAQAQAFIEQLANWGWNCSAVEATATPEDPAEAAN